MTLKIVNKLNKSNGFINKFLTTIKEYESKDDLYKRRVGILSFIVDEKGFKIRPAKTKSTANLKIIK